MYQRGRNVFEFTRKKQKITCEFCPNKFNKGTGHKCWCHDCRVVHPMCNDCYLECKGLDIIVDKEMHIGDIDEDNREKYT